ncbi:MAG TPA: hypothetical protein VLT59_08150 [Steroidobacteraceae bacterium]|nr:hypothetical protein [Steroidobacteraceae bacterium]
MNARVITLLVCGLLPGLPVGHAASVYGDPSMPLAGQVYDTVIRTNDAEELRYVILKTLTDRYADQKGITVSDAEIDAYIARMAAAMAQHRKEQEALRDELAGKLSTATLSASEREKLEAELETATEMVANLAPETGDTVEEAREIEAARREIATAFILQWKINRALYQQYGGRIGYQQGGPEPVDAYREFLEEHAAAGDFQIRDEGFERAFWAYYRNDSIHSFYPSGSEDEAKAFADPWLQPR